MIRETTYDHVFESQEIFREILNAMANPGTIKLIEASITVPENIHKSSAIIGFVLLNSDVSFCLSPYSKELEAYLISNTSSASKPAQDADFIFSNGHADSVEVIKTAKIGHSEYPEDSASLILDVEKISEKAFDNCTTLILRGPGIKTKRELHVTGLSQEVLECINEENIEFPLGVDVYLSDKGQNIVCIPRSVKYQIKQQ